MKTLTTKYHSPIFYDEEQLKGKYFSGEVLKGELLSVYAECNCKHEWFHVTKKEDAYIITQSK